MSIEDKITERVEMYFPEESKLSNRKETFIIATMADIKDYRHALIKEIREGLPKVYGLEKDGSKTSESVGFDNCLAQVHKLLDEKEKGGL
jgi:hypothetical protein